MSALQRPHLIAMIKSHRTLIEQPHQNENPTFSPKAASVETLRLFKLDFNSYHTEQQPWLIGPEHVVHAAERSRLGAPKGSLKQPMEEVAEQAEIDRLL